MDESSPIIPLAPWSRKNWRVVLEAIHPAPIGATSVGLPASRIKSRSGACRMVFQPFVRLLNARDASTRQRENFSEEVKSLAEKAGAERAVQTTSRSTSIQDSVRPLAEFQMDPQVRLAICIALTWLGPYMPQARGLSEQRIRDEILHARDLSKKGGLQRQLDYARRTAIKAIRSAGQLG